MEEETIPLFLICSLLVIFFCLLTIIILWHRYKRNLAWFICQLFFLTISLLLFVKFLKQNYGLDIASSINNSVTIAFIGIAWFLSMICMIIGLWFLCIKKQ